MKAGVVAVICGLVFIMTLVPSVYLLHYASDPSSLIVDSLSLRAAAGTISARSQYVGRFNLNNGGDPKNPLPGMVFPTPKPDQPVQEGRPLLVDLVPPSSIPAPSRDGCKFQHCPPGDPFVYMMTSYRNRGASYNRWIRTLVGDVLSSRMPISPACVCSVVADYNDRLYGPTIEAALDDWPFDSHVVKVNGSFSRAGGFQVLLDNVITTPPKQSIAFMVDADMVVYPGFMERLLRMTKEGKHMYAPACWSTNGYPNDFYDGLWRSGGTGMMAFYISDFLKLGGKLPMADKTTYGGEDAAFTAMISNAGLGPKRDCAVELVHMSHTKRGWGYTMDGETKVNHWGPNPWDPSEPWKKELPFADTVSEVQSRGHMTVRRCRLLALGKLYP